MSLELAIKKALENPIRPKGRNSISRFAAVLTDGYRTFVGFNSYRTHPMQYRFSKAHEKCAIHAEIDAIAQAVRARLYKAASGELEGGIPLWTPKMYVARVFANGEPALAKPCPVCMGAIAAFEIQHVEWTE